MFALSANLGLGLFTQQNSYYRSADIGCHTRRECRLTRVLVCARAGVSACARIVCLTLVNVGFTLPFHYHFAAKTPHGYSRHGKVYPRLSKLVGPNAARLYSVHLM